MPAPINLRTVTAFIIGLGVAAAGAFVFQTVRADAAAGDKDATLVPITACRLIDTRTGADHLGPHDTFAAADTKTIAAHGTRGECTIPADTVALSLNVTAVDASAPTFLTFWPAGDLPLAASLNPWPGQPPTPNAVTVDLSGTGSFKVYNLAGSVDVVIDVVGYYTNATLKDLSARVAALEALTVSMSIESIDDEPVVRFTGVNVQVVNGTGSTVGTTNGTGNLIVGYNENFGDTRTGSHNLIVGPQHSYSSYGGFLAGLNNTTIGVHSSVVGGSVNKTIGAFSSVLGGVGNLASGYGSSVSGGQGNTASGTASSASGGFDSSASGDWSSVSGGKDTWSKGEYDWRAGALFEED